MAEPTKAPQDEKKHMSKGEKLFNWLVYGGIGYVFTLIITVPLAWRLQYHPRWAPRFEKAAESFGKRFNQNADSSGKFLQTFTLHLGGLIAVLPIWGLEKVKIPLVGAFNKMLGDKTEKSAIEEAPKQTIGTLFWGRIAAWATVFVSLFGGGKLFPKSFQTFEAEFADRVCQVLKRDNYRPEMPVSLPWLTTSPNAAESIAATKEMVKFESKTFQYGRIASLDVFATLASATLLFIGSRFFAKHRDERREARREHPAASPVAPAPAPAAAPVIAREVEKRPRPQVEAATVAAERRIESAPPPQLAT